MVEHNSTSSHPIALSFSDSSFWCYDCESYIDHPSLKKARKEFTQSKFAAPIEVESKGEANTEEQKLRAELEALHVAETKPEQKFNFETLVDGLKTKKYQKVVFLTGAGLSVAAGIPDFRTPGTGLYDKLAHYNLPTPESIFTIDYYLKNPQPFLQLSKEWLDGNFQPTFGHHFQKRFEDEKILTKVITQNIDDLETKAGISSEFLIQAHGHSRSAHCIKCHAEYSIEKWIECLKSDSVPKCEGCGGLAKPDITFFGEQLPKLFNSAPEIIENKTDLVFIIGTSLKVFPFAFLGQIIPKDVPAVLINNTKSLDREENFLWMDGDIQENIKKIADAVEWKVV